MARPRQPNCPDCLKVGIQRPKSQNAGYCRECHVRRQKIYKRYNNPAPTIEDALAVERGELELENGRISTKDLIAREVKAESNELKGQIEELERQLYIQEAFLRDSDSPNAELWARCRDLKEELSAEQDQNRGLKATLLQALTLLKEHGELPMQLQATLELLQPSTEILSEDAEAPSTPG